MSSFAQPQPTQTKLQEPAIRSGIFPEMAEASSAKHFAARTACSGCPAFELNFCAAVMNKIEAGRGAPACASSVHTMPARRTICHPNQWSEFVPVICNGWAVSSITLPDGRRQILSLLLAGDLASTSSLFDLVSGRCIEAVTEVTYRLFKRSDLKAILFNDPDLFEKLAKIWIAERVQADELALDLGRRTATERIARQILNLAERLAKRGMVRGQTMDFPLRQQHIADATGLTPVHVSKVLGEFQRANLISISGRSLTIINATQLRYAANWR